MPLLPHRRTFRHTVGAERAHTSPRLRVRPSRSIRHGPPIACSPIHARHGQISRPQCRVRRTQRRSKSMRAALAKEVCLGKSTKAHHRRSMRQAWQSRTRLLLCSSKKHLVDEELARKSGWEVRKIKNIRRLHAGRALSLPSDNCAQAWIL